MDDEWSKLQSYQHLQNKLYAQLGVTEYGADDTILSCRELMATCAEHRPKLVTERWGILTDEVNYLLNQINQRHRNQGNL